MQNPGYINPRMGNWGPTMGLTYLPRQMANQAVIAYVLAFFAVAILYMDRFMEWYFMLFGLVWVVGFFNLSSTLSISWDENHIHGEKSFEKKLFGTALMIRLCYVIFIHLFYLSMTGEPFEFGSADSREYPETAKWLLQALDNRGWDGMITVLSQSIGLGDTGFPVFLMLPYAIFDEAALLVRIIFAFIGSHMCILMYRLTRANMDESTARLTAIFCMLNPILICYNGITLKETVMIWILVLFVQQGDDLLHNRNFKFFKIAPLIGLGLLLFTFRTVLGMVAFLALGFALVFTSSRIVSAGKKVLIGILALAMIALVASDRLVREINQITSADVRSQTEISLQNRYGSGKRGGLGNAFAKYAGAAVFAPLIFTIPFPTMVDVGSQEDMRLIHGGNFVKNVTSGFVILAMFMLLFSGEWRKHTLPLAIMLGYLVMLVFTQFAHSLRFHIPAMPFEMMFVAYAITHLRAKHKRWYVYWLVLCVIFCVGWNWFKLAGRGMA